MTWPSGRYCMCQMDGVCPTGFSSGYIQYDDMQNPSNFSGILPDGQFESEFVSDSRFYFCCRDDGSRNNPISLPSGEPFNVFPSSRYCQEVAGVTSDRQFLRI